MLTPVPSITLTHRAAQPLEDLQRQAASGLAISAGVLADVTRADQSKERLNLTHHFPAWAIGIEHLVEKAEESAAHGVDLLPAIGAFVALGEQPHGQEGAKEQVQMHEALLTELAHALPHGAEAGSPSGKERSYRHGQVYLLVKLD
jgi:hypothetical protein